MANENATKIQLRHDTSVNWFNNNPILAEGEVGIEIDKNRMKVGNGVSAYNDLEYISDTVDYDKMINKPQINNVGLIGNLSLHELGIQAEGDYATSLELTQGLANKADKENTYTKEEVDTEFAGLVKIPSIDNHDGEWLTNKDGEVKWADLGDTVVTNDKLTESLNNIKAEIPTTTSSLTNDSGFLTEIPAEYITESELAEKNYANATDLAEKANKTELPAESALMKGTAPYVADFAGTDIDNLKIELNEFLAQLKTRGIIA